MPHVDYVIQYVASLGRSIAFYRDVIGLKVRIEGDGYVEFEMDNTKFSLLNARSCQSLLVAKPARRHAARSASSSTMSTRKRSG